MMTSNNQIEITSLGKERRNLVSKIDLLNEKKFKELNDKINKGLRDVQRKYEELNNIASPIIENEYLWGLIKSTDVKKSLDGTIKIIQELAGCTLEAFQTNGKNLECILDLMKISVSIENDLYKQLDDSDCSKENIANLLHDLCSQYNIDSQTIEGLFEQSFNRTITLRTRINDLREEIFERIAGYEEKFEHFDETVRKKEKEIMSCFDNKITECNKQLENRIKEYLIVIDGYQNELNVIRSSYKHDIDSAKNLLMDSIKQYNIEVSKQYDVKFKQHERENIVLKNQIIVLTQDISKLQKRLILVCFVAMIATIIAVISLII